MLTMLAAMYVGRFWMIIHTLNRPDWPWNHLPLWLNPTRLYFLTALEILLLLSSVTVTCIVYGVAAGLGGGVFYFVIGKPVAVALASGPWLEKNRRN